MWGGKAEPTTDDLNLFVEIRKEKVIQALLWLCEHNPSLTKTDVFRLPLESSAFAFNNRYSSEIFQGIMPDSGAAGVSTAGQPQFIASVQIRLDQS